MNKILVVEDEKSIQTILKYELEHFGFEVDVASDGAQGLEMVQANYYDGYVIDWMLPVLDGIELVKKIRELGINGAVIICTAKDDDEDIIAGLNSGADDYVTKPFSVSQLAARLNAHLRRAKSSSVNSFEFKGVNIDFMKRAVSYQNQLIRLTNTEFDVLEYLVKNINTNITRDALLRDVWQFEYDGDSRLVDVHIFKVREKVVALKPYIKSVRGIGYIFNAEL